MTLQCNGDGPFERPEYLRASAVHEGSELVVVEAGAARLTVLRGKNGELHTVYGYPHPVGQVDERDLAALASELAVLREPIRIALSPLGCGAALARNLARRIPVAFERMICIADLDADPLVSFSPKARGKVRRALRSGVSVDVGVVTADFGTLYRSAMDRLEADPLYAFEDVYFETLGANGVFQVTARDTHGVCAAAIFLISGPEASYHLSARRTNPTAEAGAVNLMLLEGLRECARRGASVCILGGGITGDADDPLLRFKAGMAARILPRPTFLRGG